MLKTLALGTALALTALPALAEGEGHVTDYADLRLCFGFDN